MVSCACKIEPRKLVSLVQLRRQYTETLFFFLVIYFNFRKMFLILALFNFFISTHCFQNENKSIDFRKAGKGRKEN